MPPTVLNDTIHPNRKSPLSLSMHSHSATNLCVCTQHHTCDCMPTQHCTCDHVPRMLQCHVCVLEALVHADLVLLVCHAQADGRDQHTGFFGGFRPYVDGACAETVMSWLVYRGYIIGTVDGIESMSSGVAIGSVDDMGRHRADERSWRNREKKSWAL